MSQTLKKEEHLDDQLRASAFEFIALVRYDIALKSQTSKSDGQSQRPMAS
jgi:hypothetical protein